MISSSQYKGQRITKSGKKTFSIFHFPFDICHLSFEKIGSGNDK